MGVVMFWFALASLAPALALACAAVMGGIWVWLAVLSITVVVFCADRYLPDPPRKETASDGMALSYTLVASHGLLWGLGIWALATEGHLDRAETALLFIGLGLFFGQISNSNAHELIHRSGRLARFLGAAVYVSVLHGHHATAHLRVHHVHAATARDPNTARRGEGFWRYMLRVPLAEFVEGWRAENDLRARRAVAPQMWTHPYVGHAAGMILAVSIAGTLAGSAGIIALLSLAAYAQTQLYLSDYVQHYGLERHRDAEGRLVPVGLQHSWNAPHWYSSAMMLNAPRHSDHHVRPARRYPELEADPDSMPTLPHSLPVMAVIALVPPVWRRMMDARAAAWRQRDISPAPR